MINSVLLKRINKLCALALVIWVCWPWFGQNTGLIGGFLLSGLWCVSAFLLSKSHSLSVGDFMMILYAFVMLLSYLAYGRVYANYAFYYYVSMVVLFFLPYYMFKFYVERDEFSFLGKIAIVAILFMIVGSITSSYYTYINPNIMKTISQSMDTEYVEYRTAGIGSFGFVYMTMLAVIAVVGELKARNKTHIVGKVLLFIFIIAGVKCLIDSTFTTAILLLIGGLLLVLITSRKRPWLNGITYVLAVLVVFALSRWIGNLLVNATAESPDVTVRLHEIGNLLLGNDAGTHTEGRWEYFVKSFDCFFEYPLLGYNFASDPQVVLGGHSEWIDMFAVYGLVGGIPLLITIISKVRDVSMCTKKKIGFAFYGVVIFVFVVFGFLDPFLRLYNLGFAIFFLVPAIGCISKAFPKRGEKK